MSTVPLYIAIADDILKRYPEIKQDILSLLDNLPAITKEKAELIELELLRAFRIGVLYGRKS